MAVDMLLKSQSAASIREQLFQEFPEVFPPDDEVLPLKPMKGPPMKIELLPGTSPIRRYRCNTIPLHWQDKVKAHLETMVQKQIIERVPQGEAPEWLFSMVVVPKAGTDEPRVTVDFSPLNPFVKRPMYPCRVPAEEVAQIPPGMTHFTVLDGRHGYWQVLLDKPSSKIMTFNTPWGMFRYLRNAMGLISAGDEFNRRSDDAIAVSFAPKPKLLTTSDPRSCRSSRSETSSEFSMDSPEMEPHRRGSGNQAAWSQLSGQDRVWSSLLEEPPLPEAVRAAD
ncbi:Uncharacterized protein FKW44_007538 [Caligus rogercresseyi]|uniref:Uncharacterized protein n=1 Tax=Caligus rogercresseyi TaxID=217165 RepID=A0A7T8KEV9_CALRO|nr:Uncharacterized protein FKW44_007538 [Caligus rogercresseyi]